MQASLKIVIVDESPTRAAVLEDALYEAGHTHVVRLDETSHLIARICGLEPDVVLIDLGKPSRDKLEEMFAVSRAVKRPVAMFVEESDKAAIDAAVDAGVSAICAFRASTRLPVCATNSIARAPRSRSAKSSIVPRAFS